MSHIRETQTIIQVVRCFEDKNISHVNNKVDPLADVEIIETELLLADLEILEKVKINFNKRKSILDKSSKEKLEVIEEIIELIKKSNRKKISEISNEKKNLVKEYNLNCIKTFIYVANIDENNSEINIETLKNKVSKEGSEFITLSIKLESEISELDTDEKIIFLKEMGLEEPALERLIRKSYNSLGLGTFFTAGKEEVRAWVLKKGSLAPKAAGVIHSDFERGFIKAEVVSFDDYISFNGEQGAKSAGKLRSEGSDYVVNEGDIILFRFNV